MTKMGRAAFAARYGWPDGLSFPLAIGHRGASAHAVENTLAAFGMASDLGADMWELDTQLTKDGVCVVSHDDHLQRVFGVDKRISELTAAELAQLDGVAVPTFSEVAALARQRGAGLYVELKAAGTGPLAWRELLRHEQHFAVLGSFNDDLVRELRDADCEYPLSILVPVRQDPHALADRAGANIIHLCWENAGPRPQDLVSDDLIARAHRDGRQIVLWHEERTDIIADVIKLPVLGICSDRPQMLRPFQTRPELPIEVCLHRGAEWFAPENTLASAAVCLEMGLTYTELDVQDTSDGTPVVMHDSTVDRTTDGTGAVAALALSQIKSLDAGGWFSPAYIGEKVPTLAEMVDFANCHDHRLYVEFKSADVARTLAVIENREALHRCFFWSFDMAKLIELKRQQSQARIMLSRSDFDSLGALFDFADPWVVQFDQSCDLAEIELCRARGVRTMLYYDGDDAAVFHELFRHRPDIFNIVRPDVFMGAYRSWTAESAATIA